MSETKSKEQIEYEERLRNRLEILKKQFEDGKIHIAEHLAEDIGKSLEAIRVGSDNEIDLDTVDGRVRSLALMAGMMHEREELKKMASLSEIQSLYFKFLETNFGKFYEIMRKRGMSPHDAGMAAKNSEGSIREVTENLNKLLEFLDQFWEAYGEIAHTHVEDMNGNLKGVFGGDLFPSHDENIASKCGIYTDTIILPDPFLRTKHIFQHYGLADQAYYLMKHAMNVLQYKDLACTDLGIPLVVILPDIAMLQEDEYEFFQKLGKEDSLMHSKKLFGRHFESFEELMDFCQSLDTIERTMAEVVDGDRVLFDTEWKGDATFQLEKAMKDNPLKQFGEITPGILLASQALGRMSISNEILVRSHRLNGTPIIDAPTSWQYLVWKMEYDAFRAESALNLQNLHVIKGLNDLANTDMEWLGNIPPEVLIEIRKQGAMDEIRHILGNGINSLIEANPSNFYRSRDQIFENLNSSFAQHKKNIDELKAKKWKFAGSDIGSWLVVGSLSVTAAVTGAPVWGIAAIAANQLLDTPKLKDIPSSIKNLAEENSKLQKSPVGMLFDIHKKK